MKEVRSKKNVVTYHVYLPNEDTWWSTDIWRYLVKHT